MSGNPGWWAWSWSGRFNKKKKKNNNNKLNIAIYLSPQYQPHDQIVSEILKNGTIMSQPVLKCGSHTAAHHISDNDNLVSQTRRNRSLEIEWVWSQHLPGTGLDTFCYSCFPPFSEQERLTQYGMSVLCNSGTSQTKKRTLPRFLPTRGKQQRSSRREGLHTNTPYTQSLLEVAAPGI